MEIRDQRGWLYLDTKNSKIVNASYYKSFKCSNCDIETNSEYGLKIHIQKSIPLCGKQFETSYEMKRHMSTHACHEATFKCEDCEDGGKNEESLDVHI